MLNQSKNKNKQIATPETQKDNSSLFTAVEKNDIGAVQRLITEKKIDVNTYDPTNDFTPLHIAVARDYLEMTKLLLASQANPNAPDGEGNTPLHFAAEGNNLKLLKHLVKNKYGNQKGDINATNNYGWTILHSAASGIIKEGEDWEIIAWLLQQADLNIEAKADNGFTISDVFWQKDYSYAKIYEDLVKKHKNSEIQFNQQVNNK
ncbi:MAG: ankyrin repeat protein [Mycoplasmataceae bacterium RV_VA103A]|nr:MAG: ankyrin repeat protein [Mycoplasmataceae bacterium RV_VA103A]